MKKANLLKDIVFNDDKPAINVMFETGFTKEVRIALKHGQSMKEHQTSFPIVVEILLGNIEFGVKGETYKLAKGDMVSLEGSIPHSLIAKEDTLVRLTLSKVDEVKRVHQVVE